MHVQNYNKKPKLSFFSLEISVSLFNINKNLFSRLKFLQFCLFLHLCVLTRFLKKNLWGHPPSLKDTVAVIHCKKVGQVCWYVTGQRNLTLIYDLNTKKVHSFGVGELCWKISTAIQSSTVPSPKHYSLHASHTQQKTVLSHLNYQEKNLQVNYDLCVR